MQHGLVSILTPFKNTSEFLPECIISILNQTYSNWELLIINDHSSDNSYDIVNAFAEKDARIRLFNSEGVGLIAALLYAFPKCNGEFITRMDSDDIMPNHRLQDMVSDLRLHGKLHVALGLINYFSANALGDGFARYERWLNGLISTGKNYSEIYKECVIPSPCWMVYHSDLVACDAFNPNRYPEDYDLAFRFYKYGYKCIPSQKLGLHWRDYSMRASRTNANYAENHFIDLKIDYFLELNYNATRPLTVWGAGKKGKTVAKLLKQKNISFLWLCDNTKKIGHKIYDMELFHFNSLNQLSHPQCIVTVANEDAQQEITDHFKSLNMVTMEDYFFFC